MMVKIVGVCRGQGVEMSKQNEYYKHNAKRNGQ